jgi:ABC-type lipoprotein release transport system permease subunit
MDKSLKLPRGGKMSAVPVGYEAFQSSRRKAVTLLCIFLASATAMGITVYVDSYSVHEWNILTDVGPIAMSVRGDDIDTIVDDVVDISGVERAALIYETWGDIRPANATTWYDFWGSIVAPTQEYYDTFPEVYQLDVGRFPIIDSEVALSHGGSEILGVDIGDIVNYTYWGGYDEEFHLLTIVGLLTDSVTDDSDPYFDPQYQRDAKLDLDVDRSSLTPFNAIGSSMYLSEIAESIRRLDPSYPTYDLWSDYYVEDILGGAIRYYMSWQTGERLNQITRAGGVLLLVGLVMFLAIRYNVNDRRYERNMLMSRGASKSDIDKSVNREVYLLAVVGALLGIGTGVLLSRLAVASTGFFVFDFTRILTEPFLMSLESIIISAVLGILAPIVTLGIYHTVYSTRKSAEDQASRLAKISRGLAIIRWDVLIILLTSLMMIVLFTAGTAIWMNPILSIIVTIAPLALYVGIASLGIKGLRRGADGVSKVMSRIVGQLPSSVGIRRIGKGASSAAPAAMILVLAMSLAWSNAVIGASMPVTKLNHARFAFGGDVTFHLDSTQAGYWQDLEDNVTMHDSVVATTILSVTDLRLSAGWSDSVSIVGMDPTEYSRVGYDFSGSHLNGSSMSGMIDDLSSTTAGVIVTEDIAIEYDLEVGDSLRAFTETEFDPDIFVFSVIGIVQALSNARWTDTGTTGGGYWWWPLQVGLRTLWVNRDYLGSQLNLVNDTQNLLCARTTAGANTTIVVDHILDSSGGFVLENGVWTSATKEVSDYVGQTSYQIDRAVDTMLVVGTVVIIFAAFAIYAFEGVTTRKREIALLRSMGAEVGLVTKLQIAEMFVIALISSLILLIFGPLLVLNSLLTQTASYYIFPISVFPVIPWITILIVYLFFIVSIAIFIVAVALTSSRVDIASSLNAAWAESGPYGGDM